MRSRVSSHLLFCEPDKILRQSVVERNKDQCITAIFSLTNNQAESANTLFYNGLISTKVVSLKLKLTIEELIKIRNEYNYIDCTIVNPDIKLLPNKRLIVDFGTEEPEEINFLLQKKYKSFECISLFNFISATVYYPSLLTHLNTGLELNKTADLILWEPVDFANKHLKSNTRIRKI